MNTNANEINAIIGTYDCTGRGMTGWSYELANKGTLANGRRMIAVTVIAPTGERTDGRMARRARNEASKRIATI